MAAKSTDVPRGGEVWRPLGKAIEDMAAEKGDYAGPVELAEAVKNGYVVVMGKHSDGRNVAENAVISVDLQDYHILGLFGGGFPGGPILIRDGAPLPENLFPPRPRADGSGPRPPKMYAYTDYWFELRYHHPLYILWKEHGPGAVLEDGVLASASGVTARGVKRSSKISSESACREWLIAQMRAWLANSTPSAKDTKKVWRARAIQKFEGLSHRGFDRAWEAACTATGSGWDDAGRPMRKITAE